MTSRQLKSLAAKANPDVARQIRLSLQSKAKSPAAKKLAKANSLEERFYRRWLDLGGPELQREYYFHALRSWRFDFALSSVQVAIELDGGIFVQGRHTRGKGYVEDCSKFNHAVMLGWRIFHLTPTHLDEPMVKMILRFTQRLMESK